MDYEKPENAVMRPWGWYADGAITNGVKTKLLCVRPRQRLSLQAHRHRSEIWTIVKGEGQCSVLGVNIRVGDGSIVHIPFMEKHRIENVSNMDDLLISEVQIGKVCDEDDIIRYEDDYGRVVA